jgi:hypothetical protein
LGQELQFHLVDCDQLNYIGTSLQFSICIAEIS